MVLRSTTVIAAAVALFLGVAAAVAIGAPATSPQVDQYLETVPGVGGGRPSRDLDVDGLGALAETAGADFCPPSSQPTALAGVVDVVGGGSGGGSGIGLPAILLVLLLGAVAIALRRRHGAALGVVLFLALLAGPALAQTTSVDLGVVAAREGPGGLLSTQEVERLRQGGAQIVRTPLEWEVAQPQPGSDYDFSYFDRFMTAASQGPLPRIQVLPILIGSPEWVDKSDSSNEPPSTAPDLRAWQRFVGATVDRYGTDGSFWAERASAIDAGALRYNPITAWQVWNEPNLSPFWTNARPDAREYARLLETTDAAIDRADPNALTVLAGMLERRDAVLPMSEFLGDLYEVPGARRAFDVLAPQPFAFVGEVGTIDASLRRIRALADRNGDNEKPIWVTEIGVASAGPKTDLTTDEAGQAATLREDFALLERRAGRYGIEKALWFQWRDADTDPPSSRDAKRWQTYAGLFTFAGEPKPAWQSFCALARGTPGSGSL